MAEEPEELDLYGSGKRKKLMKEQQMIEDLES